MKYKAVWRGLCQWVLVALLMLVVTAAQADRAVLSGQVKRILVSAEHFGGCMALLSENPKIKLPSCGGGWVTFSCDGTYTSKDVAYRMLDQAQMALALGKNAYVVVDDTRRHNGYCFAYRIDIVR